MSYTVDSVIIEGRGRGYRIKTTISYSPNHDHWNHFQTPTEEDGVHRDPIRASVVEAHRHYHAPTGHCPGPGNMKLLKWRLELLPRGDTMAEEEGLKCRGENSGRVPHSLEPWEKCRNRFCLIATRYLIIQCSVS